MRVKRFTVEPGSVVYTGRGVRFTAHIMAGTVGGSFRGARVSWDSENPPAVDSLRFGAANRAVWDRMIRECRTLGVKA